jgi:hypothetical protein
VQQSRSHSADEARWQQQDPDQPAYDGDSDDGPVVPDADRRVIYEQRAAFPSIWRPMFAPDAPERLRAYGTAARHSYIDLLAEIAELRREQARGTVDVRSAARERIALMGAHLVEVERLRQVYEVAA